MTRPTFLRLALLSLTVATPCAAQNFPSTVPLITPTIRLSAEETSTAKQLTQALNNARERVTTAKIRWDAFAKEFQAVHPAPNMWEFSADFKAAYFVDDPHSSLATATTVELSADESQKALAVYNELKTSDDAVKQATKNWDDFQNELVLKHVPGGSDAVTSPWRGGIVLTPDFRTAIPR